MATQTFFQRRDSQDSKSAIGGLPKSLVDHPFDLAKEAFFGQIDHFGRFGA